MSDDNIIPVDFGKDYNETAARFAKLMGWAEEYAAQVRADPVKFVREAHREVDRLRMEMRKAREALYERTVFLEPPAAPTSAKIDIVRLQRSQYDALRRCEAVVRSWDKVRP